MMGSCEHGNYNHEVPYKARDFWTSQTIISFSRTCESTTNKIVGGVASGALRGKKDVLDTKLHYHTTMQHNNIKGFDIGL